MSSNRRNSLTIEILSRLKSKGAPEPMVKPFSPLGPESETNDNEDEDGVIEDDVGSKVQLTPPKRKKVRGSAEEA